MKRYIVKKSTVTAEYFEVTAESEDRADKIVRYGGGTKINTVQEKPTYTHLLPDFEPEI
jgi:hypothetical protein